MVKIFVDSREIPSRIPEALRELGAEIATGNLETGDYVLEANLVVERKTAVDFVQSIIDGRYLNQANKMSLNFKKIVWLIDGDIFSVRSKIHPDALDGALSYLAVVMGQTVLWYKSPKRAAGILYRMAKHAQEGLGYEPPMRKGKVPAGIGQALFNLEGQSGCGPVAARNLLNHFRSVFRVNNASIEELCAVKGIGPKKAQSIYEGIHFELPEGVNADDQPTLLADPPAPEPLV